MITVVGAGFLGSLFIEEWAKRAYAFTEMEPMRVVDFDMFEERNAANQNIRRSYAKLGGSKVTAMEGLLTDYYISCESINKKITAENIDQILKGTTFIVDAVDNIACRDLLWYWGKANKVPIMHMGISQGGTGNVEWTYLDHDSWSLNPLARLGQKYAESNKTLKPCELIAFRGLGLNMSIAGAKALGIWKGHDPEQEISAKDCKQETITVWSASNNGNKLEGKYYAKEEQVS